ncbi:hypothetical protein M378DRAFT_957682 [Amanita muscaria Koide BX008]|uniref:Uncharacterized protein n=1 Tax=Amanita muscaria (strain Koide BX008) TaxID=946122 RepID=A0A0C2WF90_AMAMK|nr:hypothetical protein M378DRAFT_957682 [Amanita muscaria Koide BX008]
MRASLWPMRDFMAVSLLRDWNHMHSHDLGFILYDVPEGQILVDGVNIKALHLEDLRLFFFRILLYSRYQCPVQDFSSLSSTERILMSHVHSS